MPIIIDAHSHIFPEVRGATGTGSTRGLGYGRIAIGDEETQLLPPYNETTVFTPKMLLANMDWASVDKAVLLQGPFYGECNAYVLEALNRYPDRLVGAAYFDPWGANNRQEFEILTASPGFQGVKLECSEATGLCGLHPDAKLDIPEIAWLWDALERHGLVLTLDLGAIGSRSYQTGAVHTIADEHPNLRIVIAHLGQPNPSVEADVERWDLWLEQIDLGQLPNVWFDTAALPAYLPDEDFPYPTAERYLHLAIERIGASKILWGTDLPGLLRHLNYPQLVKLAKLHTQSLSPNEQAMILGKNAMRVYGVD